MGAAFTSVGGHGRGFGGHEAILQSFHATFLQHGMARSPAAHAWADKKSLAGHSFQAWICREPPAFVHSGMSQLLGTRLAAAVAASTRRMAASREAQPQRLLPRCRADARRVPYPNPSVHAGRWWWATRRAR